MAQSRPVRERRDACHDHLRREGRQDGPDLPPEALPQCRAPRQPCRRLDLGLRQACGLCRADRNGAQRMITISAFRWVPEFAQGQVRDLRARWALEEAGIPYKTRLLQLGDQDKPDIAPCSPSDRCRFFKTATSRSSNPAPSCSTSASGARLSCPRIRPPGHTRRNGSSRRSTQSSPYLMNVALIDLFYANDEWAKLRRPGAVDFAKRRLDGLSKSLGDKPFLDGDRFTAGDLMMTTVLRILKHTDIVTNDKRLAAYIDRATARPAFKRALDAQVGDFREAA